MLGIFHPASNTYFTAIGELGFSFVDMKMATRPLILGDVYEEHVPSELNLWSLLAGSLVFGKIMYFLLDYYTELGHGQKDKRVSFKVWMDVTPNGYLLELRMDTFTERPNSLEAVERFCERYPFVHDELASILATCLCRAVFPSRGGDLFRPGTFLATW